MAHSSKSRSAAAEFGGHHSKDHKLVFDSPTSAGKCDRNGRGSDEPPQKSTSHSAGRGNAHSTNEEQTNEEDDEDSSGNQDAEDANDEEDPEVNAPSRGLGMGKGKRPVIRIDPVGGDDLEKNDEASDRETGPNDRKHPVNQLLMRDKKRTFSNVSNSSVLFGDDDISHEPNGFPRRKMARKLSNINTNGLLTYKKNKTDHGALNASENAIESSDEERNEEEQLPDIDDEDYSGVNLISDESDMEQQEENLIIDEEDDLSDARRFSLDSTDSDNPDLTAALFEENFFTEQEYPDIGFEEFFDLDPPPTSPEPSRKYSDSSAKRVRFTDDVQMSDSSSSSASELDSTVFPDLFMEQDKLPANIYQMIENDNDADTGDLPSSDSEHSYWDFGQEEHANAAWAEDDDFDDSSDPGSSGYETDMGDTTDEYDSDDSEPAPPQTPMQKSVLRRPQFAAGDRTASPRPYLRSAAARPAGRFIPPVRGIFVHRDWTQAIAVTNRATRRLNFYRPITSLQHPSYVPASSSSSTANNSPRTSIQQLQEDSDFSDAFNTPFHSATDIMLTGVFGSAPVDNYLFSGSTFGPPEAFYPFVAVGPNGTVVSDEDEYDQEEEDFENDLNIADFMDFGPEDDHTDVEDAGEETDVPATPATSMIAMNGSTPAVASTPAQPDETPSNRKRTTSDVMLEHFDRGVVTAFRNNQTRFRDIARLPYDPDLRASVTRPVRSGRSAETVMSPLRKRGSMPKRMGAPTFAGVTKATNRLNAGMNGPRRGPRAGTFS